jgi:hypothetical protein
VGEEERDREERKRCEVGGGGMRGERDRKEEVGEEEEGREG